MIKIILAEDNAIVRKGLARLLNGQEDMKVVGEAENGNKAMDLLNTGIQADIVLADMNMPDMDGITLTSRMCTSPCCKNIHVIILTMHARTDFVQRALDAGAKGYLLKNGDVEELLTGIRQVFKGGEYIGDALKL
jgi:DNA-binding NarL/FixJ family response regulator